MVHPGSPSNSRRGGGDDGEADRPCHCFVLTQHKEILRSDSDAWYSWKGKLDPPISTRFPSPGEDFSCYVPFQPDFISNAISIWSLLRGTLVLIMGSPSLSCTTTLHCAKSPTPLLSNKRCSPTPRELVWMNFCFMQPKDLWCTHADEDDLGHNASESVRNTGSIEENQAGDVSVGRLQLIQDQWDFCGGEGKSRNVDDV